MQQIVKRSFVFLVVLVLGLAMSFSFNVGNVSAAAKTKKITLKATATTMEVGDTVTVKVSKVKPAKASKNVKWSIVKGKAFAKLTKKKKTSVVVQGKKAGTVTLKATAKKGKAKKTIKLAITNKVLLGYILVGYFDTSKINGIDLAEAPVVKVYNAEQQVYEDGVFDEATLVGNFVRFTDTVGDKKADLLEVVKFKDGETVWDKNVRWLDGTGVDMEPALSDDAAKAVFEGAAAEQRIPMGERLLSEHGITDYSGVNDFYNDDTEVYWNHNNWFKQKSGDGLILLENYKTNMQSTWWACVMSSAETVLEWYGQRGDLNELDLAALRTKDTSKRIARGSSLKEQINMFNRLSELGLTCEWTLESSFDDEYALYDPDFIKGHLQQGHPILLIWNSWGGHGTTIIGYDDMNTETVSDDVLIIEDPYDTTDQLNDGYDIEPYERVAYGLSNLGEDEIQGVRYLVAYPKDEAVWDGYTPSTDGTVADRPANSYEGFTDLNTVRLNSKLLPQIQADLQEYYLKDAAEDADIWDWVMYDENAKVGGPLAYDLNEWDANYNKSPYYMFHDYYAGENPTGTLQILKNYKTILQSTEWACGCTAANMVIEHFGKNEAEPYLTDMKLSTMRQEGKAGATFVSGLEEVFAGLNETSEDKWNVFTNYDTIYDEDDEVHYLKSNPDYGMEWNLVPYLIEHNIPIMVGWDEWGGHWQTIIGYDNMGTDPTEDDVLILADSYDTTDHYWDGYVVESFERLMFGWNAQFEARDSKYGDDAVDEGVFVVAFPTNGYEDVLKELKLK